MERTSREETLRHANERRAYKPPSLLPKPQDIPGVTYRYIRASALGQSDAKNVSSRFREGWVPVNAKDHPELEIKGDRNGNVEIGGLILCKTTEDVVTARQDYYANMSRSQEDSVDSAFLKNNDPRMPLSKPERRSQITFGSGNKPET